jgi:hypothetical protein
LDIPNNIAASRELVWSKLSKFPGGYRLSISNPGTTSVTVRSIRLVLQP